MVQILEEKPGLGAIFSQGLSKGLKGESPNNVVSFYGKLKGQENQQRQQQQQQLQQMQKENDFLKNLGMDISGIENPEIRKLFLSKALEGKLAEESDRRKFGQELTKEKSGIEKTQNSFNRLWELAPDLGRGSNIFALAGGKTAEKTGEFQSLTGALESQLVEMVNKGTLSNTRFNYITQTLLPKPTDTVAEIKGKLKGIATLLDLEIPETGKQKPGLFGPSEKSKEKKPLTSFYGR